MIDRKAAISREVSLMLAATFWGTNFAATKYAAEYMSPLLIVGVRFTVGGVLMFCLLRILEPGDRLASKDFLPMAALGCLAVVIVQSSFTFGVSLTSAANTGLIFATAPVWGLLVGSMLRLERPTWRGTMGVGLSIAGVGIVFYEGLGGGGTSLLGDLLILVTAIGFGAYAVLSMPLLQRYTPLGVATYPILFGGPFVLLLAFPQLLNLEWDSVGTGAWAAVSFSAIFATAFAFSAWQRGISRIGANRVLAYQYMITITGVASGVVFFDEVLGIEKLIGGAVILLGVYMARRQ
jgi:drug/metabolite transporter (DMT)-like permease